MSGRDRPTPHTMHSSDGHSVVGHPAANDTQASPMTPRLMARLFVVPALIVCVLLAVAGVVVMFGSSSLGKQQSISELIEVLKYDDGQRTLTYMLLPHDKEYWQAAQELAKRLSNRDMALRPEEV